MVRTERAGAEEHGLRQRVSGKKPPGAAAPYARNLGEKLDDAYSTVCVWIGRLPAIAAATILTLTTVYELAHAYEHTIHRQVTRHNVLHVDIGSGQGNCTLPFPRRAPRARP